MKKINIIYWTATILIFLFEGVMPALTSQTEIAKEGISHLGYPAYFGVMLTVAKVAGSLAITIPQVPARIKEWAYAGLTFDTLGAFYSHVSSGDGAENFAPALVALLLVLGSYALYTLKNKSKTEKMAINGYK